MIQRSLFLILILFIIIPNSFAQSVGLVLSGGGAKGMAHIGVIRVLEENNIPIDYIAGTSIGAIVGSLYAAGYKTEEMEELFKSDDFYFWSTGKIQKEYRYFFKQQEEDPSWIELRFTKKEDKGENYHRVERQYGAFQRSFRIPGEVKNDNIDANFKDGVLKLTLPKAEESKPKKIEVK